jgi:D-alanyl-D-alanine carboxypeptidase
MPDQLAELHRQLGISPEYGRVRGMKPQFEAEQSELVVAGGSPERPIFLAQSAAEGWHQLRHAAFAAGLEIQLLSGFRSVSRQVEIIQDKLRTGRSLADILKVNAAPGYSEHHTGRALDIGCPGSPPFEESFSETPAFKWLMVEAPAFGFSLSYLRDNAYGLGFEPWHWCQQSEVVETGR